MIQRCNWANGHELEEIHHDTEWGIPQYDDSILFEMLLLESMQAGLSWLTILKKRETIKEAFDQFDYSKIAQYDEAKVELLLANPGIIRNKLKVNAAIRNAQQFLKIQQEFGSFSHYIWSFVEHTPIVNQFATQSEVPASTPLSDQISAHLKKRGFKFVGSTTIYAFMQNVGIVNDHLTTCFKRKIE